jgi:hypothetical protein
MADLAYGVRNLKNKQLTKKVIGVGLASYVRLEVPNSKTIKGDPPL